MDLFNEKTLDLLNQGSSLMVVENYSEAIAFF